MIDTIGTIHSIDEHGVYYWFYADTGDLLDIDRDMIDFTYLEEFDEQRLMEDGVQKTDFIIDMTTLKDLILDQAISEHTTCVTYYGNSNSRKYEKICAPKKRNVTINDVKQVFLPMESAVLSVLRHEYKYVAIHNRKTILHATNGLIICGICNSSTDSRQICNECGMITHRTKSHGFTCHVCDKTVCRRCVSYQSRFLVFKRNFCTDHVPENVQNMTDSCSVLLLGFTLKCYGRMLGRVNFKEPPLSFRCWIWNFRFFLPASMQKT